MGCRPSFVGLGAAPKLRILWRCWTEHTTYHPTRLMCEGITLSAGEAFCQLAAATTANPAGRPTRQGA